MYRTLAHRLARLAAVAALLGAVKPCVAQTPDEPALRRTVQIEDAHALGIGRLIPDFEVKPLEGSTRSLADILRDRKGAVLIMTSVDCPMCIKYAPRLAAIEDEYARRDVAFIYVNAVDADTPDEMKRQIRENRFDGPYLPDRKREIAVLLGARSTTEVFVLDAARTLVYRGAVDDQYGVGSALAAPRHTLLRDALDALLDNRAPRIRATWSPGCLLDLPAPAPDKAATAEITYYGRVARLLAENCVTCHRPGGPAPFELNTLASVQGRASMIEAVLTDRLMPPWHGAANSPGDPDVWVNDRYLPQEDRDAIINWLKSGRPQGDPADAPAQPTVVGTWQIGTPDLLLTSPSAPLPAEGPLLHHRMAVPVNSATDRWVHSIEFRPVETDTVHHALVWILRPGSTLPDVDQIPEGLELLGAYSPGDSIIRYPAGTARRITAGSILLIDLYARPMGRQMTSALRIGFRFGEQPASQIRTLVASAPSLSPEPGAVREANRIDLPLPPGSRLLSLTPYMRSRGRGVVINAASPDGSVQNLLTAMRYDFRWQIRYEFIEPRHFPDGATLQLYGYHEFTNPEVEGPPITTVTQTGAGAQQQALFLAAEVVSPAPEK